LTTTSVPRFDPIDAVTGTIAEVIVIAVTCQLIVAARYTHGLEPIEQTNAMLAR
jgi:Na+-transporting NADH:ubiquinone oxidoreductase subunit NqrC